MYWESILDYKSKVTYALELGGGTNGGLSLWLASKGYKVICSAYEEISEETKVIHNKYNFSQQIEYKIIDALSIPYEEVFDIICFKSMLGRIARENDIKIAENVLSQIQKALKPGGNLLFAENLSSSLLYKLLRNRYGALKNNLRYFTVSEIKELFRNFSSLNYKTFGFIGCFGRNET